MGNSGSSVVCREVNGDGEAMTWGQENQLLRRGWMRHTPWEVPGNLRGAGSMDGGADKIEKCFRNIKISFKNQFNRAIEKKKPEIPTLITPRD